MQTFFNRCVLAVSLKPNFLQTVLIITTVFSNLLANSLAESPHTYLLTNNGITTRNNAHSTVNYTYPINHKLNPIAMNTEDQTTPP
jgi:hypothetical protein